MCSGQLLPVGRRQAVVFHVFECQKMTGFAILLATTMQSFRELERLWVHITVWVDNMDPTFMLCICFVGFQPSQDSVHYDPTKLSNEL